MKTNWLITTAAVAILASTGLANAQGMNERQSPGAMEKSAPSAQQKQGGERAQAPRDGAQQRGTTGQSPKDGSPSSAPPRQKQGGDMQRQQQPSGAAQQRDKNAQRDKAGAADKDSPRQKRTGAQQDQKQGADRQDRAGKQGDRQGRAETTGRGDAKGANLTSEQRTKIRQVVVSKKIPQVTNVNFTVSVGATVPRTVRFHPIPAEIVQIHPAWRGYRVILVGSELVIVHPSSYEIVAVIVV